MTLRHVQGITQGDFFFFSFFAENFALFAIFCLLIFKSRRRGLFHSMPGNSERCAAQKNRPEGVSHIRISPAEVDYLIEHAATENDG